MAQVELSQSVVVFTASAGEEEDPGPPAARDQPQLDYFRNRERAERAAAKNASCSVARSVHQTLAQQYAALSQGRGNEDAK